MYRERGGGGSKAKTETAMASIGGEGGSRMDGKDRNKDRLSAGNSRLSVSSYPDKKPTKGFSFLPLSRDSCNIIVKKADFVGYTYDFSHLSVFVRLYGFGNQMSSLKCIKYW